MVAIPLPSISFGTPYAYKKLYFHEFYIVILPLNYSGILQIEGWFYYLELA